MPHDSQGKKLNKGDIVVLYARAEEVYTSEDACNVTLKILGNDSYLPSLICNSRLATIFDGVEGKLPFQTFGN